MSSARRQLLGAAMGSALVFLARPLTGHAQAGRKVPRIGFLMATSPAAVPERLDGFRKGLAELGYVEGQTIAVEWRYADAKLDRLPELAAELVRLNVDVIVTGGRSATKPAKEATRTIPIVMANSDDPVGAGFVASLARPGGNITGLSSHYREISAKQLELLRIFLPKLSRVAVLTNPVTPGTHVREEIGAIAQPLGLQTRTIDVEKQQDFERALQAATDWQAGALLVAADQLFTANRKRIIDVVAKHRMTAIYAWPEFVEAGGLMSYGASQVDMYRRAAAYVVRILKGARPADMPIEQPNKFELYLNLETAKRLGIAFPESILVRADRILE
jgi:putative ABC transport system substrate-binding protein